MKRLTCLLLIITLFTTGCSFIGQKSQNDDSIIPVAIDTTGQNTQSAIDVGVTSVSGINTGSPAITDASGSALSVSSSETITYDFLVDNGTGEGVFADAVDKNSILITLYYKDKDGLLIPVTRKAAKQEAMAKAAISALVDDSINREQLDYYGLLPVLPTGTKVKGMTIKNGSAVIDFSKEFMSLNSKAEEQAAVASIIYTLTGFKTISDVTIRVEGKTLEALDNGTDVSGLKNRENTFINSQDTELKEGFVKCDLYYTTTANEQFNYIVPVSMQFQQGDESQLTTEIFNALSKKVQNAKYFTSIPDGTTLLSYNTANGLAVLDFSNQIKNYGGNEKESSLISQIYYTLNQLKGIAKAKILIDGKEDTLPEGTEVAVSKALPRTYNNILDK